MQIIIICMINIQFQTQIFNFIMDLENIYCPICDILILNTENSLYKHLHISKNHYNQFLYVAKYNKNQKYMQTELNYRLSLK